MRRSITPAALLLTIFLVLTGCGSGAGTGTATTSSTPSATPTPTPTPTKTYTNADLTGLVSTLKDSQGRALTVVPAAQIDQGIIKAQELLRTAVFTPAACSVFADSNSQIPPDSTYAGGATISAAEQTTTIVTVMALKDAKVLTAQLDASRAAVASCQSFTVEVAGKKITTEVQPADAKTAGDDSFAALATQTLATGQKQMVLTMTGIKGNLAATAAKAGPSVSRDAAPELAQLINTILAHA